ncbi:hypothetical protein AC313_002779, partial [Salmonella enterica subsp. enterica]|nr:hypothetical protein [Salmonella enterica subsp. enterica]
MTKFIASNSVTRRYLKRGELMAKRRAEAAHNALNGGWKVKVGDVVEVIPAGK